MTTGLVLTEAVRLVVTDIDTGGEVGGEAFEPRVAEIVRGPGLAGDRAAHPLYRRAGAALDHSLHHRDHLIGRAGVRHLLTRIRDHRHRLMVPVDIATPIARAIVGAVNGLAVAVLD